MKQIHYKSSIVLMITALFSFTNILAQQGTIEINQDKQIDVLLKAKKDVNASEANYKIQIYSGNRPGADKAQMEFRNSFNEWSFKFPMSCSKGHKQSGRTFPPQSIYNRCHGA